MQTVAQTTTPVQHYAYYGDLYGTAELLNGSGYLFRQDGARQATLVKLQGPGIDAARAGGVERDAA